LYAQLGRGMQLKNANVSLDKINVEGNIPTCDNDEILKYRRAIIKVFHLERSFKRRPL